MPRGCRACHLHPSATPDWCRACQPEQKRGRWVRVVRLVKVKGSEAVEGDDGGVSAWKGWMVAADGAVLEIGRAHV